MSAVFGLMDVQLNLTKSIFFNLLFVTFIYWLNIIFPNKKFLSHIGFFINCGISFCLCVSLVSRWIIFGYLPLSNLYESLVFLSLGMIMLANLIENKSRIPSIGVTNTSAIFLVLCFEKAFLFQSMNLPSSLAPSLKSNWLIIHVIIMLLSYITLLTGSLLSIIFLTLTTRSLWVQNSDRLFTTVKMIKVFIIALVFYIIERKLNQINYSFDKKLLKSSSFLRIKKEALIIKIISRYLFTNWQSPSKSLTQNKYLIINRVSKRLNLLESIDNLSYRTICFGFPLLTLGIITGSIWANEAWGAYWSWDPKETWALVTWLTFASYLHSRINFGRKKCWRGRKSAIIAFIGFNIIWLCYFGVNFLGNGLHTYAQTF